MSEKPRIGVSVSARTGWRVFPFFQWALWRAGARPVRLQTRRARNNLRDLDAVIIGGGDDIHWTLYGGDIVTEATFDRERDALELALIEEADSRRMPILGVCRGAQLINVERGGTLHQDIYAAYPDARFIKTPLPRKNIEFDPDSRLATVSRELQGRVNALHTQSVKDLGSGLRAVAWDQAGIVQAIEGTGPRFVIGVQWHPEFLVLSRPDWRLFRALVEAV